jgi:hypothetical protein
MYKTERASTLAGSDAISPASSTEKKRKMTPQKTINASKEAKNILRKVLTYEPVLSDKNKDI